MIHLADENAIGTGLHLCVAAQTKIGVTLHKHSAIHRTVRVVTGHATLAQRLMLENVRLGLFLVTMDTNGIPPLHTQPTGHLIDVTSVRFVAINTSHPPLKNAMMIRQSELAVGRHMTFETCF